MQFRINWRLTAARGMGCAHTRSLVTQRRTCHPDEHDCAFVAATRALTEDSVEREFLTDDPVAQAVTYQRVTFDALEPRCGRHVCATAGRVNWT